MKSKTRSLLEELQSYGQNRDLNHIIESRASNIITSAINLIELMQRNYSPEKAELLEKKLLSSIRGRDQSRFSKSLRKPDNASENEEE